MIAKRTDFEEFEQKWLHPKAMHASDSAGRFIHETQDEMRTVYQRDRDRIIHTKAFRRLKHKTQVFLSPEGDHYRTRLTHTLEVAQISRSIARALRLNEDLTEAIALAHDLGHTPFGHCGERALNDIHPGGFKHALQSVRVVEYLEKRAHKPFRGLNLTKEVIDGIRAHTEINELSLLEAQIVPYADRIAYINHDVDDAIRAGIFTESSFDQELLHTLGKTASARISTMIMDLIDTSSDYELIRMSDKVGKAMFSLRSFLFENLYYNSVAKGEEERADRVVRMLYQHFSEHPDQMSEEYAADYHREGCDAIKDYVAGMTDNFAISLFKDLFIPKFWQ